MVIRRMKKERIKGLSGTKKERYTDAHRQFKSNYL